MTPDGCLATLPSQFDLPLLDVPMALAPALGRDEPPNALAVMAA